MATTSTASTMLRLMQTAAAMSRVPLISFPQRIPLQNRFPMLDKLKNMVIQKSSAVVEPPQIGTTTKRNGVIVETVDELPEKYKRQQISMDEMVYIEHGGPID